MVVFQVTTTFGYAANPLILIDGVELTVDDSERKQIEITKIKQEKSELESKNNELQIVLKKVDELLADKQRMEHIVNV